MLIADLADDVRLDLMQGTVRNLLASVRTAAARNNGDFIGGSPARTQWDATTGPLGDDLVQAVTGGSAHPGEPAVTSYEPVAEFAVRVGQALARLDDAALTAMVGADFELEISAVRAADVGDLGGRAAQALTLSRAELSPAQGLGARRRATDRTGPAGDHLRTCRSLR